MALLLLKLFRGFIFSLSFVFFSLHIFFIIHFVRFFFLQALALGVLDQKDVDRGGDCSDFTPEQVFLFLFILFSSVLCLFNFYSAQRVVAHVFFQKKHNTTYLNIDR
jgi:hypothetical protein